MLKATYKRYILILRREYRTLHNLICERKLHYFYNLDVSCKIYLLTERNVYVNLGDFNC